MRKTRLVILPGARCLNQLGCLLLFLACPMIAFKGQENREIEPYCKLLTLRQRWLTDDQGLVESNVCTKDGSELDGKENYAFWKNDHYETFDSPNDSRPSKSRESSNSYQNWNARRVVLSMERNGQRGTRHANENRKFRTHSMEREEKIARHARATRRMERRDARSERRSVFLQRLELDAGFTRDTKERQSELARSLQRATRRFTNENRMSSRSPSLERETRNARLARNTQFMARDDARSERRAVSPERLESDARYTLETRERHSELPRSLSRTNRRNENENRMSSRTPSMERQQRIIRQAKDTMRMERDGRRERQSASLDRQQHDARDTRERQSETARLLQRSSRRNTNENRMSSRSLSLEGKTRNTRLNRDTRSMERDNARSERKDERFKRDARYTRETHDLRSDMARSLHRSSFRTLKLDREERITRETRNTRRIERDEATRERRGVSSERLEKDARYTRETRERQSVIERSLQRRTSRILNDNRMSFRTLPLEREELITRNTRRTERDDARRERRAVSLERQQQDERDTRERRSETARSIQRSSSRNKNENKMTSRVPSMEREQRITRQVRDIRRMVRDDVRRERRAVSLERHQRDARDTQRQSERTSSLQKTENKMSFRTLPLKLEERITRETRAVRNLQPNYARSERSTVLLHRQQRDAGSTRDAQERQSDIARSLQRATTRNTNEIRLSFRTNSMERDRRDNRQIRDIRHTERDDVRNERISLLRQQRDAGSTRVVLERQSEMARSLQRSSNRITNENRMTISFEREKSNVQQARDARSMARDDSRRERRAISLEGRQRNTRDTRERQSEMARSSQRTSVRITNENSISTQSLTLERETRNVRKTKNAKRMEQDEIRIEQRAVSLERLERDGRFTRTRQSEMARSSQRASGRITNENRMISRTLYLERDVRNARLARDTRSMALNEARVERRAVSLERLERDARLNRNTRERQSEMVRSLQRAINRNTNENRMTSRLSLERDTKNVRLARDTRRMEHDDARSERRVVSIERFERVVRTIRATREQRSEIASSPRTTENRMSSRILSKEMEHRNTRQARSARNMERVGARNLLAAERRVSRSARFVDLSSKDESRRVAVRSERRSLNRVGSEITPLTYVQSLETINNRRIQESKNSRDNRYSVQRLNRNSWEIVEVRANKRVRNASGQKDYLEIPNSNLLRQSGNKLKFNRINLPTGTTGLNEISDILAELNGQQGDGLERNDSLMSFIPSFICDKVSSGFDVLSKRLWNYTVNVPASESMNGFISGGIMAVSLLLSTHKKVVV